MKGLNNKYKSALVYLQSTLDEGETATITVTKQSITSIIVDSKDEATMEVIDKQLPNHIGNIVEHILEHVCTDCMRDDFNFKDPFFVSLIKSYFDVLILNYGELVPITKTMARAILRHELTQYPVVYASEHDAVHFRVMDADSVIFEKERAYYLKAKA